MAEKVEKSELEKGKESAQVQKRDWEHLLCLIVENLFFIDIKCFHDVYRALQSTPTPSVKSPIKFPVARSQWLMCMGNDTKKCKFFHPAYREPYIMDIPELSGAVMRFSKDGWLLMSRGMYSVFFFNPFTNALINLPDLPRGYEFNFKGITFTSSPTLPDCLVFAIHAYYDQHRFIFTIHRGEESWQLHDLENDLIFLSRCNPVFHNGEFYCLGRDGNLGVFNPEECEWRVHPQQPSNSAEQNFLVESKGGLLSVLIGFMGKEISVFKLDNLTMAWQKVDSLGDQMLFVSNTTSLSSTKVVGGMENKIYLPRIWGKCGVFYSLASGLYQTFGNDYSRKNLYETGEPMNSCWIEPNAATYSNEELNWLANS